METCITSILLSLPVNSIDDNKSDGIKSLHVILGADNTTSDLNYNGVDPNDVVITLVDDETPGFLITKVSGDTTENGGQAMFAMRLSSQPETDVIVNFKSSNQKEGKVETDNLLSKEDEKIEKMGVFKRFSRWLDLYI